MRFAFVVAALLLLSSKVAADSRTEVSYSFEQVWNTAVRMVRVNIGCAISEKDKDEGYFLFDYEYSGSKYAGSIELVRIRLDGAEAVRVVVRVQGMPIYVERIITNRLTKKLSDEFGQPRNASQKSPGSKPPEKTEENASVEKGSENKSSSGVQ